MVVQRISDKSIEEIESLLYAKVEELSFIVNGLENHAPFQRLVDMWKRTNENLDESWHLFTDPVRFNEARITKFATMELINAVETMKADLEKAKIELVKLQNPDDIINKDVD